MIDISTSSNYNIRIDGSTTLYYTRHTPVGKLNVTGTDNIYMYEFPNLVSGNVYIVGNSLLSTYAGTTGNLLDLSDSADYNLKISSAGNDWPSGLELEDYTNDTYNEFVIGAVYAGQNSRANSGSAYILSGSILNGYLSSTGNTLNISSASDYLYRIDGNAASDYAPYKYNSGDFNGDGVLDTVITSQESDFNSRNNSGSVWLLYGYPHTVGADSTSISTSDTTPTLTGTVTATNSLTTVASVAYRVDNNSVTASWTACTATDGTFNSTSEAYSCTLSTQTEGAHTVYVRSVDSNGIITAQSSYKAITVTIDASGPTYSSVAGQHISNTSFSVSYTTSEASSTQLEYGTSASYGVTTTESDTSTRVTAHSVTLTGLEPCTIYHYRLKGSDAAANSGLSSDYTFRTGGCVSTSSDTGASSTQIAQGQSAGAGGTFTPIRDSYTGNQSITVIVEPGTFTSDAYVSAMMTSPDSGFSGLLANPLAPSLSLSGVLPGNAFLVGGIHGLLGVRQACGISWQIGSIQQIWYKSYPAAFDKPAAIIIPELQKKPSILALSYNASDLIPPGQPKMRFSPSSFRLAHSLDGRNWRTLPTSVVDTAHMTVAALEKIGGYYMIVSGCQGRFRNATSSDATKQLIKNKPTLTNQTLDVTPPVSPRVDPTQIQQVTPVPRQSTNQDPSVLQRVYSYMKSLF